MSYSVKVTGVACSINCTYCYEGEMRKKTDNEVAYDIDRIIETMESRKKADGGGTPILHGGEPLMIPKEHVERLLAKMYEIHGASGVQTNGIHIDDDYIQMFKKYRTHVGISFDGPWPMNKLRVAGRGMSTKKSTEITQKNIYKLRAAGVSAGLIMVLHRANASAEMLPKLIEFIKEMKSIQVSGRLNLCIIDDPVLKRKQELTEEEATYAYRELAKFILTEGDQLYWQPFRDIVDNLLGNGLGTCIFHPCSYFEADGERTIMGDGSLSNCLKTAKTGHAYLREPDIPKNHVREDILEQIPYEDGGCKGCKYWRICYGVCPSEGIDGDWRNRSRFCKAYYAAYEEAEKAMRRVFPNIQLVVDRPLEGAGDWRGDYNVRAGYITRNNPFEFMTNQGSSMPSSWKASAKKSKPKPQKVVSQQGNGSRSIPHGDHTDHGDHQD